MADDDTDDLPLSDVVKAERRAHKDKSQQIRLGFPRSLIATMLVAAFVVISIMVVMGYTENLTETETYLVVSVISGMTTIVGNLVNSIFYVRPDHKPTETPSRRK